MKTLITLIASAALTMTTSSAATLFAPDPSTASNSPSSPPTSYTAGSPYTQTTNDGTITYSPTGFTTGDYSVSGNTAYISSTETVPGSDIINTSITFTPNYSAVESNGSQSGSTDTYILQLIPVVFSNGVYQGASTMMS